MEVEVVGVGVEVGVVGLRGGWGSRYAGASDYPAA